MASRTLLQSLQRGGLASAASRAFQPQMTAAAVATPASRQFTRSFAGHASGAADDKHHDHDDAHHQTYAGLTLSKPKAWQTYGAHIAGGMMWFWILYRFSHDYKVFLGLEHPWDGHHGDAHEDAGHHDSHASTPAVSDDEKKHH